MGYYPCTKINIELARPSGSHTLALIALPTGTTKDVTVDEFIVILLLRVIVMTIVI